MTAERAPRDPVARVTFYLQHARRTLIQSAWADLYRALEHGLHVASAQSRPGYSYPGSAITDDVEREWRLTLSLIERDCRLIIMAAIEFNTRLTEERRRQTWGETGHREACVLVVPDGAA